MGMQLGKEQKPESHPKRTVPIESIIEGTISQTIFGEVFYVSENFHLDYKHGSVLLQKPKSIETLSTWAKIPQIKTHHFENIYFLDTETTGLSGGTGTLAFMVGIGRFTPEGFLLRQYFLRHPAEEPAMLASLCAFMEPLAGVCTYNGKSFDIPLMNARFIMNSLTSPFPGLPHFDLLALSRRIWRDRLTSCTLQNIESQVLNVNRESQEVPGYLIPEMYTEYLRSGNAEPMKGIFYHNAIDVLSLAALFIHSADLLHNPLRDIQHEGIDLAAIGRLFKMLGQEEEAIAVFEKSIEQHLPDHIFQQTLLHYAEIFKKSGDYSKAVLLWQNAADRGNILACEELAKYFEHKEKDFQQAISWTEKALEYSGSNQLWLELFDHRKSRLLKKMMSLNSDK